MGAKALGRVGDRGARKGAIACAGALAAAIIWLAPAEALACPTCAAGRGEGGGRDLLLVGMMAAPLAIAVGVWRAVARALAVGQGEGLTNDHGEGLANHHGEGPAVRERGEPPAGEERTP